MHAAWSLRVTDMDHTPPGLLPARSHLHQRGHGCELVLLTRCCRSPLTKYCTQSALPWRISTFQILQGFQKKWNVGPSGLVIFTCRSSRPCYALFTLQHLSLMVIWVCVTSAELVFCAILTLLHSVLCLVVPLLHEKSGRFNSIASALKRPRPAFMINGLNCLLMLIMA